MLEFDETDELFIGDEILKDFGNCLECGVCCRVFQYIEITDYEIEYIAKQLRMEENDFIKKYTKKNRKQDAFSERSLKTPCPFQKSNRCTIHDIKPLDCRIYPLLINLTKKQATLTGIYLCPQATHFYQGFLDFCYKRLPSVFKQLISLEKKAEWAPVGLELTMPLQPLSRYLDWLYPNIIEQKKFDIAKKDL